MPRGLSMHFFFFNKSAEQNYPRFFSSVFNSHEFNLWRKISFKLKKMIVPSNLHIQSADPSFICLLLFFNVYLLFMWATDQLLSVRLKEAQLNSTQLPNKYCTFKFKFCETGFGQRILKDWLLFL